MKIFHENGRITIRLNKRKIFLNTFKQINSIHQIVEDYRNNSSDEFNFQVYTIILDSLISAKEEFITFYEQENLTQLYDHLQTC